MPSKGSEGKKALALAMVWLASCVPRPPAPAAARPPRATLAARCCKEAISCWIPGMPSLLLCVVDDEGRERHSSWDVDHHHHHHHHHYHESSIISSSTSYLVLARRASACTTVSWSSGIVILPAARPEDMSVLPSSSLWLEPRVVVLWWWFVEERGKGEISP